MGKIKLIGLCGNARSGKDTFYEYSNKFLGHNGIPSKRFAFADALKYECDKFLWANVRISAFTSDSEEKDLIRPLLVAWGTNIRRKLDENCWIKKIEPHVKSSIEETILPVITDVRYPNEADWVHALGGIVIHIDRTGVKPANKEESINEPILKIKADRVLSWPTLGNAREKYKKIIKSTLEEIFNDK